jgi:hypothetical protein
MRTTERIFGISVPASAQKEKRKFFSGSFLCAAMQHGNKAEDEGLQRAGLNPARQSTFAFFSQWEILLVHLS